MSALLLSIDPFLAFGYDIFNLRLISCDADSGQLLISAGDFFGDYNADRSRAILLFLNKHGKKQLAYPKLGYANLQNN